MISRRGLLTGFASLLSAPAIVQATSIMPVKAWREPMARVRYMQWGAGIMEGNYICGEGLAIGDAVRIGRDDGKLYKLTHVFPGCYVDYFGTVRSL